MEQFLYTDGRTHGQTDTTKHYSPQTIRNGWGLTILTDEHPRPTHELSSGELIF